MVKRFQNLDAGLAIEGTGWLIAKEQCGSLCDRSCNGHALLFAPGQFSWEVIQARTQPNHGKGVFRGYGIACNFCHERHILTRCQAGYEIVELEDKANMVPAVPGQSRVRPPGK